MQDQQEAGPNRRDVIALGVGAAMVAAAPAAAMESAGDPLGEVADILLARFPDTAVYDGVPGALDGGPLSRRMDDWSAEGRAADVAAFRTAAARIDAATRVRRGRQADVTLEAARAIVANARATDAIGYGRQNPLWFTGHAPYVVAQTGPHGDTPFFMTNQQSLATPAAVAAWLDKLDRFGRGFDAVTERLRHDRALGCIAPAVLLDRALAVIEAFLAGPADRHPLVTALTTRMAAAGFDARACSAAAARAAAIIDRTARPAYARLREQVRELRAVGKTDAGVWALPHGDLLYAANVRALGDSDLSPDAINRIGLDEMRRTADRMERLFATLSLTRGSIGERMAALAQRPGVAFGTGPAAKIATLDHARRLIAAAEARYPAILPPDLVPSSPLQVREAVGPGAGLAFADPPSLDGRTPGIFWLNLSDPSLVTRITLPTMTYHEAVPGHFTAAAAALRTRDRPLLLRIANFNAFNEGWALYAEGLMAELGAYRDDPIGDLGRLQDDLWRGARLALDTGIHHLRWSREQAIAFMRERTGKSESLATAEVERYMAAPGQALGYKLGERRLRAMRTAAQARLGAAFSLPDFHRAVLEQGSLPLALVERRVAGTGRG